LTEKQKDFTLKNSSSFQTYAGIYRQGGERVATLVYANRARASPNLTTFQFPHTQDFLAAIRDGEINKNNVSKIKHPLLRKIAQAILGSKKDDYVYHTPDFDCALSYIPYPNILPAPLPENLPRFDPMPYWLDTQKCRYCGKEIVVIKISKNKPGDQFSLSFLTIECGEVCLISVKQKVSQ
jgi:hypothetical protein